MERTLYDAVGGLAALTRLAHAWHERCLADPVLSHAFEHGFHPEHTDRLAAYWAEALGGPSDYTDSIASESEVVRMHSGNGPHDEMDELALSAFIGAMSDADLPADPALREALTEYFEWAIGYTNHTYRDADDVPDGLSVPRWSWDGLVGGACVELNLDRPTRESSNSWTRPEGEIWTACSVWLPGEHRVRPRLRL